MKYLFYNGEDNLWNAEWKVRIIAGQCKAFHEILI